MEQTILKTLQKCKTCKQLKQTHLQILINGLKDNNFTLPKLIALSSHLLSLDYAFQLFQNSRSPNVVAYNTMIKCFVGSSYRGALCVYNQMKALGVAPNSYTFNFLLKVCESLDSVKEGSLVHGEIVKMGFGCNVFVMNTLLDFYGKFGGGLSLALQMFGEMTERDVVSWNSIISVCLANGKVKSAIGLFDSMPERNMVTWNCVVSGLCKIGNVEIALSFFEKMQVRDEVSFNSMIVGYGKLGDMKNARCIFDRMQEKSVVSWTAMITGYTMIGDLKSANVLFCQMPDKNVVTWNAMIAGYVHNHMFDQALNTFHMMLVDGKCDPDESTMVSVLSACSHLGSLEQGKWVDFYIRKNGFKLSDPLGNALVDMFAKCGDVETAKFVFNKMENKSIVTWTTMISGLAVNGQSKEALDIFYMMHLQGIRPDDVAFIAALSACTHGGLVEEGKRIFHQMVQEFQIKPRIEHYGCIVDLLGRAGKLEETIRFIESMHLEPNAVVWATLLGSCKIHGNSEFFELVTRKVLDQEPSNPSYITLISNLSASRGHWEDSSRFRMAMRWQGLEKAPGCSLIQVGNNVYEFMSKDKRHNQQEKVYGVLLRLNGHINQTWDPYEYSIYT